ncbi:MAG: GGDEF domain-containing protein [Clostridia bacterium]|nr:GGDEF domain-containing protein [Clostridia bacterium]
MVSMSFLYIYLIFNIALSLFAAYIFFRVSPDLVKKNEYIAIKVFIVAFEAYLVFNTLWTLQEYDILALPHAVFVAVCFLSLTSVVYNSFCFFAFTMIHFDFRFNVSKKAICLGFAPFFVAFVLLVISLFNGMIFSVTPDNHIVNGPAYIALPLCSFVYFIVIVRVSVQKAIRLRSKYARRDALGLTACVVFLVGWVLLDDLFDRITIIPVAIFAVIFVLFTSMQQSNIYTDALTKMNNRRKTEEYLTGLSDSFSEDAPTYLFMCDINSFKQINDSYGHAEGDEALIMVSNAIKAVISVHKGFAARYGGDEFIWVWRCTDAGKTAPDTLICEIEERLKEICGEAKKPYALSFSAGYVCCTDPQRSVYAYIKEADERMYERKKEFHRT